MKNKPLILLAILLFLVSLFVPYFIADWIFDYTLDGEWFWALTLGLFGASIGVLFILNRRMWMYKSAMKKDPDKSKASKVALISGSALLLIFQLLLVSVVAIGGLGLIGYLLGLLFSPLIKNIYIEGGILSGIYWITVIIVLFRLRILYKVVDK
jgi:hypothetical protein